MEKDFFNNKEFSALTGIPASTLRKWLNKGKLDGIKKDGMWMIPESQLRRDNVLARTGGAPPASAKAAPAKKKAPMVGAGTYSISEFSTITYLTEKGVAEWLKNGRIQGSMDAKGRWRVDAANLETPDVKRLLRE